MKKRIIKLSNIFVMTENYVSNIGLTSGKMGIIMFLYYSSRIVNCKSYQDLADSLMDKLFEDIKSNTNFSFSNGLAGLPFAINRLVKDKFIDADPDDIFIQLDKKIHSGYERRNINDFAEDFPLFSYGLYLLERNIYNNNESEMEEAGRQGVDVALTICEEVYNSNFVFNNRTLAYTNSVLYFLIRLNGNQHYYKRSNLIIELIMSKIVIALSNDVELWNSMEVTQSLGNMIDKKNIISSFFLSTANQFSCENRLKRKKDNSNLDINNAWLSILVCPSCYKYHFDPEMIDDWIDDTDLFYDNSKLINNDYRYLIGGGLQLLKLI